jgi:hypothetical protein
MTEKEKIMDEINVRRKQLSQIQHEIAMLWSKYYALNRKKDGSE